MLHYCTSGTRNYHIKPVKIHKRHSWEFQIFYSGRSCPVFSDEKKRDRANFWIFRPDCPHGWEEKENKKCEVAVFHFSEVPETLNRLFYHKEALAVSLPQELLDEVRSLALCYAPEVINPNALSLVRFRLCLDKLSLFFLEEHSRYEELILPSREKMLTNAALAWLSGHMEEGPEIQELADKMGYDVSHLRRIFQETIGESPIKAFTKQRMIRAAELLKRGNNSVIDIAMVCGYRSHSTFTRAFKGYYGISPTKFRLENQDL